MCVQRSNSTRDSRSESYRLINFASRRLRMGICTRGSTDEVNMVSVTTAYRKFISVTAEFKVPDTRQALAFPLELRRLFRPLQSSGVYAANNARMAANACTLCRDRADASTSGVRAFSMYYTVTDTVNKAGMRSSFVQSARHDSLLPRYMPCCLIPHHH